MFSLGKWIILIFFTRNEDTKVYNFVSSVQHPITWQEFLDNCKEFTVKYPSFRAAWYYFVVYFCSRYAYLTASFFLEFIPACLLDVAQLITTGRHKYVLVVLPTIFEGIVVCTGV
jgi:hypothetical protein